MSVEAVVLSVVAVVLLVAAVVLPGVGGVMSVASVILSVAVVVLSGVARVMSVVASRGNVSRSSYVVNSSWNNVSSSNSSSIIRCCYETCEHLSNNSAERFCSTQDLSVALLVSLLYFDFI
jgi:hypothetical protein